MNLVKSEYEAMLKLLERVQLQGLGEARAVALLAQKLEHRIANWFDGSVTGFAEKAVETAAATEETIAKL